ncbi:MAG: LpxI family protein [Endomicrobiia bacterium]
MNTKFSLGIIAGLGLLPEIFVTEVKNVDFYIISFKNYFNKKILNSSIKFKILTEWNLNEVIDFFKQNNVKNVVFLGYIPHKILLEDKIKLDIKAQCVFNKLKKNSAMEIFKGLVEEFNNSAIQIDTIDKYIKNSFAEKGEINGLKLTEDEFENIKFGYEIAKEIARLDIGLTVVMKNKIVIAVEALEGTDKCILRAVKLAGKDCCVVKVARPNQDMRFDLPVIGPTTVKVLNFAKAKVLAVESEKTLILNKEYVIEKTKKLGIKLYGI